MRPQEFIEIRHFLGKTQNELSSLLSISTKSVQSFEQGWRNIPVNIERQLLFYIFLKTSSLPKLKPCWDMTNCPDKWRKECPAWEFKAGYFCWFINGTYCHGKLQDTWGKKMETCHSCKMFRSMSPFLA